MKLLVTHADTPLYPLQGKTLLDPQLHIHKEAMVPYEESGAVFAFWSTPKDSDEAAWNTYLRMREAWNRAMEATPIPGMKSTRSIEDGRLVGGRYERLRTLWEDGVRIFTPLWGGETSLGGAFNQDTGLTARGKETVQKAMETGMQIDLSHAGDKAFWEMVEIAEKMGSPLCATHSNARAVCDHKRNLTDDEIKAIVEMGGWCGICLVEGHIGDTPDEEQIIRHILHYLRLGAEKALTFGGDLDGTHPLAGGYAHAGELTRLHDRLVKEVGKDLAEDIFWNNAYRHIGKWLI